MHAIPRPAKGIPEDQEKKKKQAERTAKYAKLTEVVLTRRQAKQYDAETMKLAAALLELNPDVYTAWNFRREALTETLQGSTDTSNEQKVKIAEAELALTEAALKKQPKSYPTWQHRQWVVGLRLTSLEEELKLVTKFLSLDERNFHGWTYRRFIVGLAGTPAEEELEYTQRKIEINFSNYSAWHARTSLLQARAREQPTLTLQQMLAGEQAVLLVPTNELAEEYRMVHQAFYTEPEDQSAWFYHRWLLAMSLSHAHAARGTPREAEAREELAAVLVEEITACQEVVELCPSSKWGLLSLARLFELQQKLGVAGDSGESQAKGIYHNLIQIDPMRRGFYEDCLKGTAEVIMQPL